MTGVPFNARSFRHSRSAHAHLFNDAITIDSCETEFNYCPFVAAVQYLLKRVVMANGPNRLYHWLSR